MRNQRNLLELPANKDPTLEGKVLDPSTERKTGEHKFSAAKTITAIPREIKAPGKERPPQVLASRNLGNITLASFVRVCTKVFRYYQIGSICFCFQVGFLMMKPMAILAKIPV